MIAYQRLPVFGQLKRRIAVIRNTRYLKLHFALVGWLIFIVTGCSDPGGWPSDRDQTLSKAVERAEKLNDPLAALRTIDSTLDSLDELCSTSGGRPCISDEVRTSTLAAKRRLLRKALSVARRDAYEYVYSSPRYGDVYTEELAMHASTLLEIADQVAGLESDRKFLAMAGKVAMAGDFAERDSTRAVTNFARAWAAGDDTSANAAANLFADNHDFHNAYLWSIRCVAPCSRSPEVAFSRLRANLSPESISRVEALANDTTIMQLNISGDE